MDMMYFDEECDAGGLFGDDNDAEVKRVNNIVLISYSVLSQNKEYHSSPPTCCRGCNAILSVYSILLAKEDYYKKMMEEEESKDIEDAKKAEQEMKDKETDFLKGKYVKDLKQDEKAWICEFCGVHNRLAEEVLAPETADELYILKKAVMQEEPKEEAKTEAEQNEEINIADDTKLVFCIDVSGSMGDSHEVIKDGKAGYITRMKLVVEAVLKQIEQMKITHPNRRVGLVTFDDRITLYGDCTGTKVPVNISLSDFEKLFDFSKDYKDAINKPLKESCDYANHVIKNLYPGSSTALGPGLLCALGTVQGKPGSRIILCTDGLANVGLGSLSNTSQMKEAQAFYERVGDIAVDSGVSVSIITIQGNACRVDALGPLTDRTAGTILRVDPADMDLSDMASNSLIAINVKLRVIMHEGLAFQNESSANLTNNGSILVKNVGSVTKNNEAYMEYRVKELQALREAGVDLNKVESLPLQSQITYTDLKGNEFVRVISKQQELTKDQNEAGKDMKADILTNYVAKETANLALQGKTDEAKKKNADWMGFAQKVANGAEMSEKNQQVLKAFQAENEELHDLIAQTEAGAKSTNVAQKDEVASKLYLKKQQKKK